MNCTKFPITLNQNWHGEFYSGIPCTQANKHISEIFSLDTEHAHVCLCLTKIYGSCSGNRFRKVISADNHWVINLGMSNKSSDRQAGPDTRTQVKFCLTLKPIIKKLAYILHFFWRRRIEINSKYCWRTWSKWNHFSYLIHFALSIAFYINVNTVVVVFLNNNSQFNILGKTEQKEMHSHKIYHLFSPAAVKLFWSKPILFW